MIIQGKFIYTDGKVADIETIPPSDLAVGDVVLIKYKLNTRDMPAVNQGADFPALYISIFDIVARCEDEGKENVKHCCQTCGYNTMGKMSLMDYPCVGKTSHNCGMWKPITPKPLYGKGTIEYLTEFQQQCKHKHFRKEGDMNLCNDCGLLFYPKPTKIEPLKYEINKEHRDHPVVIWAYITNLNNKVNELIQKFNERLNNA